MLVCSGCDQRFEPSGLKRKASRVEQDESDAEIYPARKASGKEAPRTREDGYDTDLRKKRRRRRRRDEAGDNLPEHPLWNPVTMAMIGLVCLTVGYFLVTMFFAVLRMEVPKPCVGMLLLPFFLAVALVFIPKDKFFPRR